MVDGDPKLSLRQALHFLGRWSKGGDEKDHVSRLTSMEAQELKDSILTNINPDTIESITGGDNVLDGLVPVLKIEQMQLNVERWNDAFGKIDVGEEQYYEVPFYLMQDGIHPMLEQWSLTDQEKGGAGPWVMRTDAGKPIGIKID